MADSRELIFREQKCTSSYRRFYVSCNSQVFLFQARSQSDTFILIACTEKQCGILLQIIKGKLLHDVFMSFAFVAALLKHKRAV